MDNETPILDLTQDMLTAAIAWAEKALCLFLNECCFVLPDRLEAARYICDCRGRSEICRAITNGGRNAFDLLLDLRSGEGRLHPWPDTR